MSTCHGRFVGPTFSVAERPVIYNCDAVCVAFTPSRLHLFTKLSSGHVTCFVRESSELKKRNQKNVSWCVD